MNQNLSGEVILPDEIFSWSGKTSQYLGFCQRLYVMERVGRARKLLLGKHLAPRKKRPHSVRNIQRLELKNHDLAIILAPILMNFLQIQSLNLEDYNEAQLKIEDMLEEKPQHRKKYGTPSPHSFKKETIQGYNFSRTSCY